MSGSKDGMARASKRAKHEKDNGPPPATVAAGRSSAASKTVCFNVGGTKYTVARSTVEKYRNTKLAKDCKEEEEVFFDRDGIRFRFVLDYMRDQKVHLPINCSKESLLEDLKFFGFDNVPKDAVRYTNYNLTKLVVDHKAKVKEIDGQIKELQLKKDLVQIAGFCFTQHFQTKTGATAQSAVTICESTYPHFSKAVYASRGLDANVGAKLNECLAEYGLHYISCHSPRGFHQRSYVNGPLGLTVGPIEVLSD